MKHDTNHPHHQAPRWVLAALLAALATLGPFAIDTYLPAFDTMTKELNTSMLSMQQTLSLFLAAFGFMFLFHGALSDSFGRKPVILWALVVFTIASVGCALSRDVQTLILFRILQGLSVGAGMVVGRAMIRDLFSDAEAQKLMSMVTLFFGLAPAVAPMVGGYLYAHLGWASIFWFLAALSGGLILLCGRELHETLPPESRQSFHPVALMHGYWEVGANIRFLLLSFAVGLNFNAFFLYIVSAPVYLPQHLGLGPTEYSWLFVPGIAGIMTGAFISGRVAGRWSKEQTVTRAYGFMIVAAVANLLYVHLAKPAVPWAIVPIYCYAIGSALAMPSISLMSLDMFPARRGMSASLQGFVSGMVNATTAGLISPALSHSPQWLAVGMVCLMAGGLACWVAYLRSVRGSRLT
ncbi:MAG: multidrug effflux MFS transporter [Betaproteobacteria bacterium]|nr:multidrug effflux MFS transporter [Betaproteobacteria bacterium]